MDEVGADEDEIIAKWLYLKRKLMKAEKQWISAGRGPHSYKEKGKPYC